MSARGVRKTPHNDSRTTEWKPKNANPIFFSENAPPSPSPSSSSSSLNTKIKMIVNANWLQPKSLFSTIILRMLLIICIFFRSRILFLFFFCCPPFLFCVFGVHACVRVCVFAIFFFFMWSAIYVVSSFCTELFFFLSFGALFFLSHSSFDSRSPCWSWILLPISWSELYMSSIFLVCVFFSVVVDFFFFFFRLLQFFIVCDCSRETLATIQRDTQTLISIALVSVRKIYLTAVLNWKEETMKKQQQQRQSSSIFCVRLPSF